jgi:hypothetical protein
MKMLRLLSISAFVLMIAAPAAFAQTPQVSTLPVDSPLDVGGTILQPGVYTIRVLPTLSDRNRVQITSPDLKTIYATVLTVPHDLEPNEEIPNSRFIFYTTADGQARALRTWFPPDSQWKAGHDIVYEESRAKELARLANEPIVSYRGESIDTAELETVAPDATISVYTPAPVETPAPVAESTVTTTPVAESTTVTTQTTTPAPMTSAQNDTTSDTALTTDTQTSNAMDMPQTAGNDPLLALAGLLAVGGAVAFRLSRKG